MQARREVVIRIPNADLGVLKQAVTATGIPLDSLLLAGSLRFISVDAEFRRGFASKDGVSWGEPPPRFAAAELVSLQLNDVQYAAIEKAAGAVRFQRESERVEVAPAQFILGAATRFLNRNGSSDPSTLEAELTPFLAPAPPPLAVLEQKRSAALTKEDIKNKGALSTVIVSSSMMDLGIVPTVPARPNSKNEPTAIISRATIEAAEPQQASAQKTKARGAGSEKSAPSLRPVVAKKSIAKLPKIETDIEPEAPAERAVEPLKPFGLDLRLTIAVGSILLLSLVASTVWALSTRKSPPKPPADDEVSEVVDVEQEPVEDEVEPALPGKMPGKLLRGKARPSVETAAPISNEAELARAAEAERKLKDIQKDFHHAKTPSAHIDSLLEDAYGRPKVGADGKLVQGDLSPEHRYDVFIKRAVDSVAKIYAVPPELVRAIIKRESNFNPDATSSVGALGLMQVMPFNAPKVGLTVADLKDPERNILGGTRLIAVLLSYYDGDLRGTIAAYNAKARPLFAPIPDNEETPGYVAAVLANFKKYQAETTATAKP